jgi:uncharacterized protein YeeX (DUF496 family)
LTNDDFFVHFKEVIENDNSSSIIDNTNDIINTDAIFDELDKEISHDEIKKAIHRLKHNKSCSEDYILNELFIKCADILMSLLHKLFTKF